VSKLDDLVARLEKVSASIAKKQTLPLREEQNDLMREIQQIREKQRASGVSITPDTVSGGTGVNGE
jgi:hypothetical protein